jgi:hypothetical protein
MKDSTRIRAIEVVSVGGYVPQRVDQALLDALPLKWSRAIAMAASEFGLDRGDTRQRPEDSKRHARIPDLQILPYHPIEFGVLAQLATVRYTSR